MDLGLFMMPLHDARRNYTATLEQDRQAIIYADQLGYQEAWVGEHYTCASEPVANPLQFFATLIHATKQIKFATAVIALPQHHPAMVAGDVAQFDHLSKGRFIMGVGPGGLTSDFELFKTTDLNRAAMTTEAIEIIKKIWTSDPPYHIKGKFWEIDIEKNVFPSLGFGPMLKPYQNGGPPVAISVMSPASSSARQAGENTNCRRWRTNCSRNSPRRPAE
jgi:alkanesulfonate monooxygenase SsuD/methylene tetrahydromethanopterin reductase-like flavin-dependent oxidoreductase (luciferase family)